jgi:DNA mismatch repair protein MutS
MLLYGMNASGKSSYMKSVGLALIMSQAGCWVPCQEFTHTVVKKIFTRISGNDDYMRGKSSFALEMEELSTILREADSNSIVLGDELCRGTE